MNNDKARELFSSYFENSLDPGMRLAVDNRLKADPVLAGDYAAFAETMKELQSLQAEAISVPIFLRDRIATRIEQSGVRAKPRLGWQIWMRGLGLAGVAAIVLIGGFVATRRSAGQGAAMGSILPTNVSEPTFDADHLKFDYANGLVTLSYRATSAKTIIVSSGLAGSELKRFDLDGQTLESPIRNSLDNAALFSIQVVGEANRTLLAVPGSKRTTSKTGSGSVTDLAVALSGYYHVPVLIQATTDGAKPTSWNFDTPDARQAATNALGAGSMSVDQRPSGLIVIM